MQTNLKNAKKTPNLKSPVFPLDTCPHPPTHPPPRVTNLMSFHPRPQRWAVGRRHASDDGLGQQRPQFLHPRRRARRRGDVARARWGRGRGGRRGHTTASGLGRQSVPSLVRPKGTCLLIFGGGRTNPCYLQLCNAHSGDDAVQTEVCVMNKGGRNWMYGGKGAVRVSNRRVCHRIIPMATSIKSDWNG